MNNSPLVCAPPEYFFPPKHKAPLDREGPLEDSSLVCRQGTVLLKDNTTPSTPVGLLLFPRLSATWWSTRSVSIEESV
ncbi:hypothetical protein Taro_041628 [Colocasia esculenta]|uniref:Uncharacterized protein n=1 Tax=Colocasia esculenta TaxID=4460 RepID=A0A843X0X0_COLES|nr:hypothetical protein [Colocasia esculenta]